MMCQVDKLDLIPLELSRATVKVSCELIPITARLGRSVLDLNYQLERMAIRWCTHSSYRVGFTSTCEPRPEVKRGYCGTGRHQELLARAITSK